MTNNNKLHEFWEIEVIERKNYSYRTCVFLTQSKTGFNEL